MAGVSDRSTELMPDPALAVAERQLVMLGELAEIGMEVSRAFASSSIAASRAVEAIVSEDYFMPETGRARGCGAKDAAEAFQKVSRSLRVTLMLEKATAEAVRDLRAGIVPAQPDRTAAAVNPKPRRIVINDGPDTAIAPDADVEGSSVREERLGGDRELAEFERPEVLPYGLYTTLVDNLAADIGATIDWDTLAVTKGDEPAAVIPKTPEPTSAGQCATGRPGFTPPRNISASSDRAAALSP